MAVATVVLEWAPFFYGKKIPTSPQVQYYISGFGTIVTFGSFIMIINNCFTAKYSNPICFTVYAFTLYMLFMNLHEK